jgi:hypothetical protein
MRVSIPVRIPYAVGPALPEWRPDPIAAEPFMERVLPLRASLWLILGLSLGLWFGIWKFCGWAFQLGLDLLG